MDLTCLEISQSHLEPSSGGVDEEGKGAGDTVIFPFCFLVITLGFY